MDRYQSAAIAEIQVEMGAELLAWADDAAAIEALRHHLMERSATLSAGQPKELPLPSGEPWQQAEKLPEVLSTSCTQLGLELGNSFPITALAEPPPWEGPLLALHRLMEHHPEQILLLCPVDMADLSLAALQALLAAADPTRLQLAAAQMSAAGLI